MPGRRERRGDDPQQGAAIYTAVCQDCHMPGGGGAVGAGAYPVLAANPHLADAVDYVRSHFGNQYKDKTDPSASTASRP